MRWSSRAGSCCKSCRARFSITSGGAHDAPVSGLIRRRAAQVAQDGLRSRDTEALEYGS